MCGLVESEMLEFIAVCALNNICLDWKRVLLCVPICCLYLRVVAELPGLLVYRGQCTCLALFIQLTRVFDVVSTIGVVALNTLYLKISGTVQRYEARNQWNRLFLICRPLSWYLQEASQ